MTPTCPNPDGVELVHHWRLGAQAGEDTAADGESDVPLSYAWGAVRAGPHATALTVVAPPPGFPPTDPALVATGVSVPRDGAVTVLAAWLGRARLAFGPLTVEVRDGHVWAASGGALVDTGLLVDPTPHRITVWWTADRAELAVDGLASVPIAGPPLPARVDLSLSGDGPLVNELSVIQRVAPLPVALPARELCYATPRQDGYVERVRPYLLLAGHFVGWAELTQPVFRQRLVLAPRIGVWRGTRLQLTLRLLDSRWVSPSGSYTVAAPNLPEIGTDVGIAADAAWMNWGPGRTIAFAAGRVPRSFGLGLNDANGYGHQDGPAGPVEAPLFPDAQATAWYQDGPSLDSVRSYDTSGDGVGIGAYTRMGASLGGVGLVLDRRRAWCVGLRSPALCPSPLTFEPVYEAALHGFLRPEGALGGDGVELEVALRSSDPLVLRHPSPLIRGAARTGGARGALGGEVQFATDVPGDVAYEYRSEGFTGVIHGDLAVPITLLERLHSRILLGSELGAAVPTSTAAPPAFHPDYTVDHLVFAHGVALAAQAATGTSGSEQEVPSFGGVYDAAYARVSVGLTGGRQRWFAITTHGLAPMAVDGIRGATRRREFLGPELDVRLQVNPGPWRFLLAGAGWWPSVGRGWVDARRPHDAFGVELRLGREFDVRFTGEAR